MISSLAVRQGIQRPRLESCPPGDEDLADDVIALAAYAGLHLDPWEQYTLRRALRRKFGLTLWAAFEILLIVARQNGKGSILEARQLGGLFILREPLQMHSAHEFKTAAEAFRRIVGLIESTPDLMAKVKRITRSHGDEGIELKPTPTIISGSGSASVTQSVSPRLRFMARTNGSGRGFSGDTNYMDEAFNLQEMAIGALMPTMAARPNPQLWYTSSAVDQEVHPNGQVLARVRRRGLAGGDPSLCFMEWSVDEDRYRGPDGEIDRESMRRDPEAWAESNPGMGIRISPEHIERERASMGSKTFEVERLSLGDWPAEAVDSHVIDPELWESLLDDASSPAAAVAFALDVAPNRSTASIASAGPNSAGAMHLEVVESRRGTSWVVQRALGLVERWGPVAFVVNAAGPAGSLIAELEAAGITVTNVSARDMGAACMGFEDDVKDDKLRHIGQPVLNSALGAASKRKIGNTGAWAWDRRDQASDISPLVAVTLARWGYLKSLTLETAKPRTNNAFFI